MKHRVLSGPVGSQDDGRLFFRCACGARIVEAGISSASAASGNNDERVDALLAAVNDHIATDGAVGPPNPEEGP